MDSNQWMTQEMNNGGLRGIAMGEIASSSGGSSGDRKLQLVRPQKDKVVNCPRCNSTNTKFCYYNNYSLTQPRYFCKSCRRYWTEGGTLRNVPVGGGSRKHKRSTSLSAATTPSSSASAVSASAVMSSSHKMNNIPDLNPPSMNFHHHHGNPSMDHQGQDLNLGGYHFDQLMKSSPPPPASSALELLRTGALLGSNSSSNDFMNTNAIYANNNGSSSGFSFQELKPGSGGLRFSSSVHHANIGGIQENGGSMMFPFGGMMKNMAVPSSTTVITTTAADHDQVNGDDQNNQVSNANGFWNNAGSW